MTIADVGRVRAEAAPRLSGGRLEHPLARQRRAEPQPQHRALLAVPDAGRPDRARRRRRRRRQCGVELRRPEAPGHRHAEMPRRAERRGVSHLPDPDPDPRRRSASRIGLVVGAIMPFVAKAALADLVPVSAIRVYPLELGLAVVYGLLVTLGFALGPLGRARQLPASSLFADRAVHSPITPPLRYRAGAGGGASRACGARHSPRRRPRALALLYRRGDRRLRRAAARGDRHHGGRAPRRDDPRHDAPARRPQHPSARRAHPERRAVARARADAPRQPGADRHQPPRPALRHDHREGAGLLLPRRPGRRSATPSSSCSSRRVPGGAVETVPMLRGRIVAVDGTPAARAHRQPRARAGRFAATAASPIRKRVPQNSTVVAGEWWPAGYDGEPLVSLEQEIADDLGLDDRRHDQRQRARPQRHGADRQSAPARLGIALHQLRHGLLAEHASRRAARPSRDACGFPTERGARRGARGARRRSPARFPASPRSASARRSTRSTPSSPIWRSPSGSPRRWRSSSRCWCSAARSPPATGSAGRTRSS